MLVKKIHLYDTEAVLTGEIKPIKVYDSFSGVGYPCYIPQIGSEIIINEILYKVKNVIYHDVQECVDVIVYRTGLFD